MNFVRPDAGPHYDRTVRFQGEASADLADLRACKEIIRDHLLAALSECRDKTRALEVIRRETVIERITKFFHPDADGQVDSFSDCFAELEASLIDQGAA